MSQAEKKVLQCRQAIEPTIGHTKHDRGMPRCYLKGSVGDALHAISCAAGYNIRWLIRAIMRLGLKGLFALAFLVSTMATMMTNLLTPRQLLLGMRTPANCHVGAAY